MMNEEQLMEIREAVAGGHNRKALGLIDAVRGIGSSGAGVEQEPQPEAEVETEVETEVEVEVETEVEESVQTQADEVDGKDAE